MTSRLAGDMVGGRYRLAAELGSGGFGRVWRARDETLDVDVAIKELRLPPGMPETERAERLARATREARTAARLRKHDGIVAIHDVVIDDGLPWIVMELVDGCSLSEHVKQYGPLPVSRAIAVAAALLRAIGAAHREGVVHRDIKPANIMLAENGKVLLTDFGTAVHSTDTALTATGMFIGSAEYTAPERLRGSDGLPTGDLFSLGVTLYQAVEGVSPFRRDTQEATLAAVLLEEAPAPQRTGPLTQLITRLLDKDPGRRPTVDEALAMAGGIADEQPATTVRLRRDTRILPTRPKRWQPVGVAALVVAITAMAVISALGVAGLPDAGETWEHFEHYGDNTVVSLAVLIAAVADVVLAGLVCAGFARFLPANVGKTVTAVVGVAGLVFGCGATAFALHGAGEAFRNAMELSGRESAAVSLALISVVVLVAVGSAWSSQRLDRRETLRGRTRS
ncbi:serine/threonine-protein kinase [Streptosporangium sp. NBC_01756]|uniref:serine/threonine-protein kinase n=1 Tax=Streptosporangium sp. NBC_01756 TaxID=2975950 RepID=UPI002DDBD209|nr:serine/threonine-protein kinase [Streptosporangium sp. NBC_01756]WSC86206.1 serine/threonine protein kinase [Streptosporangium sp. NBC_01756]